LDIYGNIDSKFRFVILASKRAKQLLRGAKPRIKTKSKNPIRIAQSEVKAGVIDFEILPMKNDDVFEPEERIFVGPQIHDDVAEGDDAAAGKEGVAAESEEVEEESGAEPEEEASDDIEEELDTDVEEKEE